MLLTPCTCTQILLECAIQYICHMTRGGPPGTSIPLAGTFCTSVGGGNTHPQGAYPTHT